MMRQITMQEALDAVSERYCKGHHYENVALSDEMVRRICEVKSLVNMGFIATAITDAALQHLAALPKLAYLFLQDSDKISGEGFRYFAAHAKLEHIGIENVSITDEGLKAIVQIPKLKSLRLVNSRVSFAGLLAAADTKIQFYLDGGQFSKEQIAEFEQAQRDAAKSKKKLDPQDAAAARSALLEFFAAMSEWEKFATSRIDDADDGEVQRAQEALRHLQPHVREMDVAVIRDALVDRGAHLGIGLVGRTERDATRAGQRTIELRCCRGPGPHADAEFLTLLVRGFDARGEGLGELLGVTGPGEARETDVPAVLDQSGRVLSGHQLGAETLVVNPT